MFTLDNLLFLLQGVPNTLAISFLSFALGFALGIPTALLKQLSPYRLGIIAEGYEKIMRGVPVLVFMLLFNFGLAGIIPIFKSAFFSAVFALGLRSGAFQSQIFRGSINAVGRDQMMAAISLGMSRGQAFRHIILPQAFIVALPGLGSEIALLIKDSSYAFVLGVLELTKYSDIVRKATRSFIFPYLAAALIYILITFPIANYLDRWGSRLKTRYGLR
ncbi:MAG TPA: amino acid ABC transporter permease [Candidatus Korarchaeota archaeon]|nr:amino acid ABC transporter permease [Candidatus Korarchaeota archaeon]